MSKALIDLLVLGGGIAVIAFVLWLCSHKKK
jgi:hypothetical protein